jgi:nucleotide-binding universal stress UspA family protein
MTEDARPVVAAFDGSPAAEAALRAAATLFGGRTVIVVSVWEPGLAMVSLTMPDATGFTYIPPSPEDVATVDRVESDHAEAIAQAGARIVSELGATAIAKPVRDEVDVGETLAAIAEQEDAAVVVVGTRGLRGLRGAMVGSTSKKLLHGAHRPVLVVQAPPDAS